MTQLQPKPLVTFCLLSYRQEPFVRQAVEGALSQTYQPLEILLSDDASPDHTFDIMRQVAGSCTTPHRVVLNRNERNLGLCGHVNRIIEMASGEIIVMAAGDDISMSSRVEETWRIFSLHRDVGAVNFRLRTMDENGTRGNLFLRERDPEGKFTTADYVAEKTFIPHGASAAYRRDVIVGFGPLQSRCPVEDVPLMARALIRGFSVYHSVSEEVLYRVHGSNLSLGDGGHHLDGRRIFYQQMSDLRVAVASGWMSREEFAGFRARVGFDFHQRRISSGFHMTNKKMEYFLSQILCLRHVPPRRKRRYLKTALRSALGIK